MNYKSTVDYLFNSTPLFQQIGSEAYKEGLKNTYLLDEHMGHPHQMYRTIHVAGTNGKGSVSHTLAAVLQSAGYKVGLYTSPHLIDFRERIRVNGKPISEEYVVNFVEEERAFFEPLHPSFFELTTAMAFKYFAYSKVDVAVIEVGLGGRLDCTNIISPDLSIITNISFDHMKLLGNTLESIATEKAGIIKEKVPIVVGETTPETMPIFISKAKQKNAPIYFAEQNKRSDFGLIEYELKGLYQKKNKQTILTSLTILKDIGYHLDNQMIQHGFLHVTDMTGLMGRWQKLRSEPTLICDTGHNTGGMKYVVQQLLEQTYKKLHIVIGMVNDKDISGILQLLPKNAIYYFTQASVQRALKADELMSLASRMGLKGKTYKSVIIAVKAALASSEKDDLIFVGGSNFTVADLLINLDEIRL